MALSVSKILQKNSQSSTAIGSCAFHIALKYKKNQAMQVNFDHSDQKSSANFLMTRGKFRQNGIIKFKIVLEEFIRNIWNIFFI